MRSSQVTLKVSASDDPFTSRSDITNGDSTPAYGRIGQNLEGEYGLWHARNAPCKSQTSPENSTDLLQGLRHSHLRSLSCLALHAKGRTAGILSPSKWIFKGEVHLQQLRRSLQIQTSSTKLYSNLWLRLRRDFSTRIPTNALLPGRLQWL